MVKLTKSKSNNLRKNIKPNATEENRFISRLIKGIKRQVGKLKSLYGDNTYNSYFSILNYLNFPKLDKMSNALGDEVLKKNHNGFLHILESLTNGLAEDKRQERKNKLFKKQFKKVVNSLAKEKQIYKPLLEKFKFNIDFNRSNY